jgi:branched-chain amino acid transport system permease protein
MIVFSPDGLLPLLRKLGKGKSAGGKHAAT